MGPGNGFKGFQQGLILLQCYTALCTLQSFRLPSRLSPDEKPPKLDITLVNEFYT